MVDLNDIVTVVVDRPSGVSESRVTRGNVGLVIEIVHNATHDGKDGYLVATGCDEFIYLDSEIRLSTDEEIRQKFIRMIKGESYN